MPRRAELFDGCPTSHGLDVIGDRWALLLVRDLLLGPKRFSDLRRGLPRISANVLSQRLEHLQAAGVLVKHKLPPPAAAVVYELTERGYELEAVLKAIGNWSVTSPLLPDTEEVGIDTFVLALRESFDPGADPEPARYELRVGPETFAYAISRGRLEVSRGRCERPTAVLAIEPDALGPVFRGRTALADAVTVVSGPAGAAAEFAGRFRPPVWPQPDVVPA